MDGGAGCVQRCFFSGVERVGCVVTALCVDVWAEGFDDRGGAFSREDGDVVDAAEGREDCGAVEFGVDWAGRAFEFADGCVGI